MACSPALPLHPARKDARAWSSAADASPANEHVAGPPVPVRADTRMVSSALPKPVLDCVFPKLHVGDGETGRSRMPQEICDPIIVDANEGAGWEHSGGECLIGSAPFDADPR